MENVIKGSHPPLWVFDYEYGIFRDQDVLQTVALFEADTIKRPAFSTPGLIPELILKNEGIRNILTEYKLNKDDLYEIYINISAAGMGQWVKGHYIPLSTIAFNEPLLYVIESKKQDVPWMTILGDILDYWKGNIAQGTLFKKIKVL